MKDFIFFKEDWFYQKYADKLKERFWTFKIALNLFLQREGKLIVETGTLRNKDEWEDGQSTLIFGEFCRKYGKHLITVDNNKEAIKVSKRETWKFAEHITYIIDDSHRFLGNLDKKIDLLYLDSFDTDPDDEGTTYQSQLHQLLELKLAFPKLSDKAIILLDDNSLALGGKTLLTKEFLLEKGFTLLMDFSQSLWTK